MSPSAPVLRLKESSCCWSSDWVIMIRPFVQCSQIEEQMMQYPAGVVVELNKSSLGELSPHFTPAPMILVTEKAFNA